MTAGLELTLGNCFSCSSSLEYIITFKRSFIFLCSSMDIGRFSHKMSLEETWDGTATSPVAFLCFGVCTDQVAASCLAGFITSRQSSFSVISLLLTTAESVEKSVPVPFPTACVTAVPQSRTWRGDNRHCCAGSMQVSSELDAAQIHR